jgi:hypothetical protein
MYEKLKKLFSKKLGWYEKIFLRFENFPKRFTILRKLENPLSTQI